MPLNAIRLLADAGHDVHLFTNPPTEDRPDLPDILPKNITIHYVQDGRKRTKVVDGVGGKGKGVSIRLLLKQIKQIKALVKEHDIELFHAYGYGRTATLTAILGFTGLRIPKVVTLYGLSSNKSLKEKLTRNLWKSLSLVTTTSYVKKLCESSKLHATLIRQGSVRNLINELGDEPIRPTKRVLFWRDPTEENGADICVYAFDKLASKYPEVTFEMAIRPHWNEIDGVEELEEAHKNVHIHKFPYKEDATLADLVTGSCCIVLPFRKHSIHPQLAIAESLAAGIPVVTSDLCSSPELVQDGETGFLVPVGDAESTTSAIDEMLSHPEKTTQMGINATKYMHEIWGWNNYQTEISSVYTNAIVTAAI